MTIDEASYVIDSNASSVILTNTLSSHVPDSVGMVALNSSANITSFVFSLYSNT